MIDEQFPVALLCIFYRGPLSQVCFVTIHCGTCIADTLCKCVIDRREIKGSVLILMPVQHLLLLFIKEKVFIQVQIKAGSVFLHFPDMTTTLTFFFFSYVSLHCALSSLVD